MILDRLRLQKFFEKLDLFGVPVSLKHNGNTTHKTLFGSLISLVLITYFSYHIHHELITHVNKEIDSVIHTEILEPSPRQYQLKANKFSLAFGLQDSKQQTYFSSKVYKVEAEFIESYKNSNNSTNTTEIQHKKLKFQPVQCTPQHFQVQGAIDQFLRLEYQHLFCLPLDIDFSLEGQINADVHRYITLKIYKCLDPTVCLPSDEVNALLGDCNLQLYFVDYIIELTDKYYPVKPFVQNSSWKSAKTVRNVDIRFRNTYIDSIEGSFSKKHNIQQHLTFSSEKGQALSLSGNSIFEVSLSLEKYKESRYIRKYTSMNQAISRLGGLLNFFIFLGFIVISPISQQIYSKKLLNHLFTFQMKSQLNSEDSSLNKLDELHLRPKQINVQHHSISQKQHKKHSLEKQKSLPLEQSNSFLSNMKESTCTERPKNKSCYSQFTANQPLQSGKTHKISQLKASRFQVNPKENIRTDLDNKDEYFKSKNSNQQDNKTQFSVKDELTINSPERFEKLDNSTFSIGPQFSNQQSKVKSILKINVLDLNSRDEQQTQYPSKIYQTVSFDKNQNTSFRMDLDHDNTFDSKEDSPKQQNKKMSQERRNIEQNQIKKAIQVSPLKLAIEQNSFNTNNSNKSILTQVEKNINKKLNFFSFYKKAINSVLITSKDMFVSIFCKGNAKSKMINYGLQKIDDYLDIATIITKLIEVEKLKRILLNSDQIKLFEFIPPPVIHEQQFQKEITHNIYQRDINPSFRTSQLYENNDSVFKKACEAQLSYNRIYKQSNALPKSIDKSIQNLIGLSIKQKFEQNFYS